MIIALPCVNKEENAFVSENLGRTNYFYIYDTNLKSGEFFANDRKDQTHGAGIKTAEFLLQNKVEVLITPRVGEKALDVLRGNLKIFLSENKSIEENIELYLKNELKEF